MPSTRTFGGYLSTGKPPEAGQCFAEGLNDPQKGTWSTNHPEIRTGYGIWPEFVVHLVLEVKDPERTQRYLRSAKGRTFTQGLTCFKVLQTPEHQHFQLECMSALTSYSNCDHTFSEP